MEQGLYVLLENPVLRRLVIPLNPVEINGMVAEIEKNGGMKGVRVWGNTILSDYEYYEYCREMNIPFNLVRTFLETETEAVAWVCKDQLQRKSLPDEMRKYLIGKRSLAEYDAKLQFFKELESRVRNPGPAVLKMAKHRASHKTVLEQIAADYSLVYQTVQKYESYAQALDTLYVYSPRFVTEYLQGHLNVSIARIERMVNRPVKDINRECQQLLLVPKGAQHGVRSVCRIKEVEEDNMEPVVSIKNMPAYDPDAEIISLTLTIPSWTSSMLRVKEVSNMAEVSIEARIGLKKALTSLKSTADKMLATMRKDFHGRKI